MLSKDELLQQQYQTSRLHELVLPPASCLLYNPAAATQHKLLIMTKETKSLAKTLEPFVCGGSAATFAS